ncbi:hypothetical protein JST56_02720 [Candidatus Dependentiae bacterium]|jgi:hypothetical protein|nr:hypothetical protein [Candidatus Dependentiae bacterium]
MEQCANRALEQIKNKNYAVELQGQGIKKVELWGIACHHKAILLISES